MLTDNSLKDDPNPMSNTDDPVKKWRQFSQIFMISSLMDDGIQDVKDYLFKISKPGEWIYNKHARSDQSAESLIVNTVRATLLDFLPQEIPYRLKCELELYELSENGMLFNGQQKVPAYLQQNFQKSSKYEAWSPNHDKHGSLQVL